MRAYPVSRPHLGWWLSIGGGLTLVFALALSDGAWSEWVNVFGGFPGRFAVRCIAAGAAALHVSEGVLARLAVRKGLPAARCWGIQTLLVGYPSLRLLLLEPAAPERRSIA
ncbi:MAG: DUF4499 domain-containing protein [Myxococcota bacterium]